MLTLATTTSVQDSGLLDELLPEFTKKTGIVVRPIAVGSGEAIAMGRRGAADVLLVHSPEEEAKLMADGIGRERRTVMSNSFLVVGPPDDAAGVRGSASAREAFDRIAEKARFISRGDRSGTHARELKLWGRRPSDGRYVEAGAGMGETLLMADQKDAYTLSDVATYLAFQKRVRLVVLFEGGEDLINRYSVIRVKDANPAATAFVEFFCADALQIIRDFGKATYGRPLFVPEER